MLRAVRDIRSERYRRVTISYIVWNHFLNHILTIMPLDLSSLTYIWGKWYLPIPRSAKLLYVAGQPLGMPRIDNPTQEDIDHWHAKYLREVERLFFTYKERVPEYKHKNLTIV